MAGSPDSDPYGKELPLTDPSADVHSLSDKRSEVDEERATAAAALDDGNGGYHDVIEQESEDDFRAEEQAEKHLERPDIRRIDTSATEYSVTTQATSHQGTQSKKPWHKKLNPLRWGAAPPVPEVREVSREYKAGFLGKLFFTWQGSLMAVSRLHTNRPLKMSS